MTGETPKIDDAADRFLQAIREAEWRARGFVQGMRMHGVSKKMEPCAGEFSLRFKSHPWVMAAETEGWAPDLRAHLVRTVKALILAGKPFDNIEDLMPQKSWVDKIQQNASRYALAKDWRDKVIAEHGTMEAYLTKTRRLRRDS